MKKLFFASLAMLFSFSVYAQNTNTLLNSYINVKNALVSDDGNAATQAIHTFYQSVLKEEDFPKKGKLRQVTEKLNAANGLEKQRIAFAAVSTTLWEMLKGATKVNQVVYYQYCPMRRAYWLSFDEKINNPYFGGSSMSSCGMTKAVIGK